MTGMLSLLFVLNILAAPKETFVEVTFQGKPLRHFPVRYVDVGETRRSVTNARGVTTLVVRERLSEWDLASGSDDYVFRQVQWANDRWQVAAVRSATWRQRNHPRPCDAWRAIMDIPRGSLSIESADDYDEWYASLTPQLLANCNTLAQLEKRVGSKAPWYFYEFKAQPAGCVDGRYVQELDWTAWYRRLLEQATHASPGKCIADWERWWAAQGYPPIPDR